MFQHRLKLHICTLNKSHSLNHKITPCSSWYPVANLIARVGKIQHHLTVIHDLYVPFHASTAPLLIPEIKQTMGEMKKCITHPWKSLRFWRVICLQFPWAPVVRDPVQERAGGPQELQKYEFLWNSEGWRDGMRRKRQEELMIPHIKAWAHKALKRHIPAH